MQMFLSTRLEWRPHLNHSMSLSLTLFGILISKVLVNVYHLHEKTTPSDLLGLGYLTSEVPVFAGFLHADRKWKASWWSLISYSCISRLVHIILICYFVLHSSSSMQWTSLSISYCSSPLFNQINILPEPNTSLSRKHVCVGWISHINSLSRCLCKWAQRQYYGFCFGVFRWMQALVLLNMSCTVQTPNICQTW